MNIKEYFRIDLNQAAFDVVIALYVHFFLTEVLSKRLDLPGLLSLEFVYAANILLHFFILWQMTLIVVQFREWGFSFFPGFFGFVFFIIAIVMFIEGSNLVRHLMGQEARRFEGPMLLWELFAMATGISLGIFSSRIKELITEKVKDKVFTDSLFISMGILFSIFAALFLCYYDQLVLWEFVIFMKMPTSFGVYVFMGLSGLFIIRIIKIFSPDMGPINVLMGAASLTYYVYAVVSSV
ncbi:hypothetical protein ACFL20_02915 [Spirochaetota bacterium]